MPRNMSFALTTEQFKAKTKTVTRRFGWWFLNPGDIVCGVEKAMGLKKGEKINKFGLIRIISSAGEPLCTINKSECIKEGFPEIEPEDFIQMLCSHSGRKREEEVNRIEFEYL